MCPERFRWIPGSENGAKNLKKLILDKQIMFGDAVLGSLRYLEEQGPTAWLETISGRQIPALPDPL